MPSTRRKRAFDEANLSEQEPTATPTKAPAKATKAAKDAPKEPPSLLQSIRNMWQFANLYQWILLFGSAIKLDNDFDIEDLEAECLKPYSTKLQEIGLTMLKYMSSHRGLTLDLFDEYTRRQFLAKAPQHNLFGSADEPPLRFADFDVFTKIRVLQSMTQLIMMNPEKLRERTEEQKDMDQTNWRIEPYGWDREERTYYVLDDNRVYRTTAPPEEDEKPSASKPKKNSKKAKAAARASKRRRISTAPASEADGGDEASEDGQQPTQQEDDGFGGMKWECIAVTLEEVNQLLSGMRTTKDADEKVLRDQLQDHLVPILEKQVESKRRKQQQREKELLALEKMAHAKRSSRLAHKFEHQKAEEQAREEERKRREEEALARKQEKERLKVERERESRLMSREQRLKEREIRRLQHEEELANLSEDSKRTSGTGDGRLSERRLKAEIDRNKRALEELDEEEEDWIFDCVCGTYGQVDDGTHSVACERCNVWQHSKCLGIKKSDADRDDFHFICDPCKRSQAEGPKKITIKINRPESSSSAAVQNGAPEVSSPQTARSARIVVELGTRTSTNENQAPVLSPRETQKPNGLPQKQLDLHSHTSPPSNPLTSRPSLSNGLGSNPFASMHPTLSPPDQSPNKARAYTTLYEPLLPGQASPIREISPEREMQHLHVENGQLVTGNERATSIATPPRLLPPQGATILPPPPRAQASVNGTTPTHHKLISTPQLTPAQQEPEAMTPLPPSRGGLSPTKHSPPPPSHSQLNGSFSSSFSSKVGGGSPRRSILPPAAPELSPSPPQQISTPPVKHATPQRRSRSPLAQPIPQVAPLVQPTQAGEPTVKGQGSPS